MVCKIWDSEKIRYLIIGGYNTFIGYGIFALLWMLFGHSLHYTAILFISHVVSVANAFFCHRFIVFRKEGSVWVDFMRFNLVYLGALVFSMLALPVLIELLNLHPLIAQAVLVIVTALVSYFLHGKFSFKNG
jgi:putative flippase GtrA